MTEAYMITSGKGGTGKTTLSAGLASALAVKGRRCVCIDADVGVRSLDLTLGISDVSMEEGSLRCDGNISLRRRGSKELGTKTELKNMNSFKNLHDGLAFEICRQAQALESGEIIRQETRHWEPANKRTISMRVKESTDDYRLFPDPNLAPYHLSEEFVESVRQRMPELPPAKRVRYREKFALSLQDAHNMAADPGLSAVFDAAAGELAGEPTAQEQRLAQGVSRLLLNEITSELNTLGRDISESRLEPASLLALVRLLEADELSSNQGKQVVSEMLVSGETPEAIIERLGLRQVSDSGALEAVVDAILAANPEKVAEYQAGKTGLLGFFVGQAMREMKGQGNPKLLSEIISTRLANS